STYFEICLQNNIIELNKKILFEHNKKGPLSNLKRHSAQ
ncbi:MAG: hypothetical protein ACI8ZN_002317, partial [Bacteroidia bacterium]